MDLASRNGTYVNGERVRSVELRDGDTIKAGNTTLKVSIAAPAAPPPAPAPAALDAPTLDMPAPPPPLPNSLVETLGWPGSAHHHRLACPPVRAASSPRLLPRPQRSLWPRCRPSPVIG